MTELWRRNAPPENGALHNVYAPYKTIDLVRSLSDWDLGSGCAISDFVDKMR